MTEKTARKIEGQWQVIVREWHREEMKHTEVGKDVEVIAATDKSIAIVIAAHMFERHAHRAKSGVDLEVSIAAVDALPPL